MTEAWIITLKGAALSEAGNRACRASFAEHGNELPMHTLNATTPEGVDNQLHALGLTWTYPMQKTEVCPHTGLRLHPYKSRDNKARIACALSHFRLWDYCAERDIPVVVCEDDCVWLGKFDPTLFIDSGFGMVSLNDPRGATRKARVYHEYLTAHRDRVAVEVPTLENEFTNIPHGLPGHSCYILMPWFARILCEEAKKRGLWINDCFACKERFPKVVGASTAYYSTVSGRRSQLA